MSFPLGVRGEEAARSADDLLRWLTLPRKQGPEPQALVQLKQPCYLPLLRTGLGWPRFQARDTQAAQGQAVSACEGREGAGQGEGQEAAPAKLQASAEAELSSGLGASARSALRLPKGRCGPGTPRPQGGAVSRPLTVQGGSSRLLAGGLWWL